MISTQDRSGWFGASDTAMIMGNWKTKTFRKWWLTKLGLNTAHYTSTAMNAGTYYEHAILDYIGAPRKDHQILIPELRLRINLDGDAPATEEILFYDLKSERVLTPGKIHEVKTHKAEKPFRVSKAYWQQVQVQSFGKLWAEGIVPVAKIHAYGLTEAEYKNFFLDIDPDRLTEHPIEYDPVFVTAYLKRLGILVPALERGTFPEI